MLKSQNVLNSIYPITEWEVVETEFLTRNNFRNETIFSLGNGYIGFRGNFEEGCGGVKDIGLDGTYINGFYESETIKYGEVAYGYAEKSQTMLNVANSKFIRLFIDEEEFSMFTGTVTDYKRVLSLKEGILRRSLVWCSPKGKKVKIRIERLVSLKNKHVAVISYEVTPINFDGKIKIISALDGEVKNLTVENDPRIGSGLKGRVLDISGKASEGSCSCIVQKTKNSGLALSCAAINHLKTENEYTEWNINSGFMAGNGYEAEAAKGRSIILKKYISYITSRECNVDNLPDEAVKIAAEASETGFDGIKAGQEEFLSGFWMSTDIEIKGDPAIQQGIRVNMFHLLQSAGRDGITNIGAKGLAGEGYEGHYFWDTETFILPFFLYNNPGISRKLLEYRYSILDKARERARQMSHTKGALYPWRTINGEECSAYYPAGTAQYHINADIAFAVKKYMDATLDYEFLIKYGAEMLFETARLWADLGFFNPNKGNKYCISGVTGPDEYNAIVDNNCYTNLMAAENMSYAYKTAIWMKQNSPEQYKRLVSSIKLEDFELEYWKKAAENIMIPYDEESGIFMQDDGFMNRIPWDFENTPECNYPLLLHYHPLVIYRHRVCKQADLVLALFMLGDRFTLNEKKINYDYYEKVTTHDSSLSTAVFSIVASEIGYHDRAYEYFMRTARMDLDDYHGNTRDGIHAANMAGTWMSVVNGFAGMRTHEGTLSFAPYLPEEWEQYSFKITYKGRLIKVTVNRDNTTYELLKGEDIVIVHNDEKRLLKCTDIKAVVFDLDGVIVSTDNHHFEAWSKIAEEEGIYFDRNINNRLRGVSRMESLDIILERSGKEYTPEQKQMLAQKKNEYYRELIRRLTPNDILPGVKSFVASCRAAGLKTAIASSSKNAHIILKLIDLFHDFDSIISGDDISKSKPDPEVYITAAKCLGVTPGECIAVEDARAGIDAAVAAGMATVGVGDAASYTAVTIARDSLEKFSIAELIQELRNKSNS